MADTLALAGLGVLFLVAFLAPSVQFFLPIRPTLLAAALAATQPWWLVALVATLGSTLGTVPLYAIVRAVEHSATVQRWYRLPGIQTILRFLRRHTFLAILILVLTPLPDQLIGIAAGAERYPLRKLLAATLLGRAVFYTVLVLLALSAAPVLEDWWRSLLAALGV